MAMNETTIEQEKSETKTPIKIIEIFDLDRENGYRKSEISLEENSDLLSFLTRLSQETMNSKSSRAYRFKEDSYVAKQLLSLNDENINCVASNISNALYQAEISSRFKTTDGSFILAKIENKDRSCYLLTKLDFKKYFEEGTYSLKSGLPEENAILKSCLVNIDKDGTFDSKIFLTDKNGKISVFWHTNFLQSTPLKNDELNTKNSYDLIQRELRKKVKKVSEEDFYGLKDCVNSYFHTKDIFSFDDFIEDTIKAYSPANESFCIEPLLSSLNDIKDAEKFDGTFEIFKSYVKSKSREKLNINNGVTLVIEGPTNGIIYEVTHENKEYILIESRSNNGRFKRKELD